ncbi:MAG TPA: polysaccharide pyruvyl transferase CsaB [Firmicutes bacterium]|nr:polysaccharide pyruvyl transferase CsaB [Bacillota bacterium]
MLLRVLLAAMALDLGGAETHVVSLARSLHSRGHTVLVASAGGAMVADLEEAGIPHHHIPLASRSPWCLLHSARRLRRLLASFRPDVIHAHARIPAFLCQVVRGSIPLVTTYHGIYASGFPWSLVTRAGDLTVTVSEDVRDYLVQRFRWDPQRITVVPNGIDVDTFHAGVDTAPLRLKLREEAGWDPDDRILLHVSRFMVDVVPATLAVLRLAPAFLQEEDLRLVIVGDGPERGQVLEAIDQTNRKLGRRAVHWVGRQSDLVPWYNLATLVLGSGRVALEAMACGLPVCIMGGQGSHGEVAGLVTEGNWATLAAHNFTARGQGSPDPAATIREALGRASDPAQADALGRAARRAAEQEFSLTAVVEQIEQVYRQAVSRPARQAMTRVPQAAPPAVAAGATGNPPRRVAIAGYYGFDNAGDEAIAEALVYAFRNLRPRLGLTILSAQPSRTAEQLGVQAVDRFSPLAVTGVLRRSDLLVFGGGTLLQDVTSLRSLAYYLAVLTLARLLCKPVVVYANGLGPIRSRSGRYLAGRLLAGARQVSLRDRDSVAQAMHLGVTAPRLTADPAFLLPTLSAEEIAQLENQEGWVDLPAPIVGVAVRRWGDPAHLVTQLAAALDTLAGEGATVLFLPMQHPGDVEMSEEVQAAMRAPSRILKNRYRPRQLLSLIGCCHLVIGMRLHALIFAVARGVPVVGISYDPKVDSFLHEVNCPLAGTPATVQAAPLAATCRGILADTDLKERLTTQAARFRQMAWENARDTLSLLDHLPVRGG